MDDEEPVADDEPSADGDAMAEGAPLPSLATELLGFSAVVAPDFLKSPTSAGLATGSWPQGGTVAITRENKTPTSPAAAAQGPR